MYLMIDNYDSFVYNLVSYFEEEDVEMLVYRNDAINFKDIEEMISNKKIEAIVISPGPKAPKDVPLCLDIIKKYFKKIPILGVCLGHQMIGTCFGANVIKGAKPMHGKVEKIKNNGKGLFKDLPASFNVTRYHSLRVEDNISKDFEIDARTEDGVIMAISHKKYPLFGVQFHPEAVLTEYGHEMLRNFIAETRRWNAHV